jgi:hypothetical protein
MDPTKPWYLSKTILVNIIMAIALVVANFNPAAAAFIQSNFALTGVAWSVINVFLRLITKQEIS